MSKPPLVIVRWRDAYKRGFGATLSDAVKDADYAIRHTVGWLIEDTEKGIRLAMTYDPPSAGEEAEYDDRFTIPRAYIEHVRYITRTRKPRVKKAKQDDTGGTTET